MPPDLKARVKAAAEANNRSMNAEIVATLEEKYPAPIDRTQLLGDILEDYWKMTPEERDADLELLREIASNQMAGEDPESLKRILGLYERLAKKAALLGPYSPELADAARGRKNSGQ